MASFWTNRGLNNMLDSTFRGATLPTVFYAYLVNSTPTVDTNTFGELTEASNYDGEQTLNRNSTDFDVLTEDDAGDQAFVQIKDLVYTASGGTCTATFLVITDDNVTEANRQVWACIDLGATQNIPDTDTLTVQDIQLTLT